MGKTRDPWAQTASVFCVIEMEQDRHPDRQSLAVVISIPGREGTFRKVWKASNGRIGVSEATDLVNWIAVAANNALLAWTGVQGELPFK